MASRSPSGEPGRGANLFLLDGGSVSDFYRNTLGSITGVFLGLEAVQEAKVVTNSYGAAEPGVGGGVLSIVTKAGGNTFHGSVFEFFRDGRLNARSFFDEQKPNLRRHQFGMAAGGRLVRDRTFFFATAERLDERMGIGRVTTVPSLAAREGRLPDPVRPGWTIPVHPAVQPFLALFPLPNGQDFGDGLAEHSFESEQRANETLGQIRVDHALTASQRLFVRYTRTTGTKHEPWHFPGFGIDWQGRNHFLTVEDRLALGSTLAGTLRFAYGGTNVMQTDEVGGRVFEHLAIIPGRPMPQLANWRHAQRRRAAFVAEPGRPAPLFLVRRHEPVEERPPPEVGRRRGALQRAVALRLLLGRPGSISRESSSSSVGSPRRCSRPFRAPIRCGSCRRFSSPPTCRTRSW